MGSRAALGSCLAAAGRPSPPRLARQAPRSRLRLATTVACALPRRARVTSPPCPIRAAPVGHEGRRARHGRPRGPRRQARPARSAPWPTKAGALVEVASLSADRATCFPRDRASCPHARRSAPASLPQVGPHRRGSPVAVASLPQVGPHRRGSPRPSRARCRVGLVIRARRRRSATVMARLGLRPVRSRVPRFPRSGCGRRAWRGTGHGRRGPAARPARPAAGRHGRRRNSR